MLARGRRGGAGDAEIVDMLRFWREKFQRVHVGKRRLVERAMRAAEDRLARSAATSFAAGRGCTKWIGFRRSKETS
eukprot:6194475-Pleurochrysis_carterae.AAC.2